MHPLLSRQGFARLDDVVKPGLLCAFDFDGTLAPLVAEPDRASLPAELRQRLIELSGRTPVAVITGRGLDDIRARLGFAPDFIIGNHGIEGLPEWQSQAESYRQLCHAWHDHLKALLAQPDTVDPGILLENKLYSLSVHYRLARDPAQAGEHLRRHFMRLEPAPRIVSGKYVFNLLPRDADDKGTALERLMQLSAAHAAIYVGDDITDEDVFRLRRPGLLSVRVEPSSESEAEFFLERWQDMPRLLDELIVRLCERDTGNRRRMASINGF